MADNILRLRVESKEYDSKIERARQGLLHLENELRKMGQNYGSVSKDQVEFVRSLGQMSTVSQTARGKIGELTKAFTDLSIQYKQLSDEEKRSPFGKAMSSSLDQLRQRIQSSKQQLDDVSRSLNNMGNSGGGMFGGDKWSGMLQVFGGNMLTKGASLAMSAITKLTGEIESAIYQGIELAKQGEGIRNAFTRLGRGDILQGLREATHGTVTDLELMKAAVKFNDFKLPIEELGTMLAFAQQKAKDTGQSVDYMVESIVTGLGRKSLLILDNLGLSAAEIKEKMKETGDMTSAVGAIIREQMAKSGDYIETAADRATQANVELENAMEELGRTFQPLSESANNAWNSIKIGALDLLNNAIRPLIDEITEAGRQRKQFEDINGGSGGGQTHLERVIGALKNYSGDKQSLYNRQVSRYAELEAQAWKKANDAKKKYDSLLQKGTNAQVERKLYDQWQGAERVAKSWQKMSREYQTAAKNILNPSSPSTTLSSSGTTGTTTSTRGSGRNTNTYIPAAGSIDAQAAKVQELQKAWRAAANDDSRQKIKKEIEEAQFALDILMGKTSGIPEMNYGVSNLAGFSSSETRGNWQLDKNAMEAVQSLLNKTKSGKTTAENKDYTESISKTLSGLTTILSGIEATGFEIPDSIKNVINTIQGLMSIVQGVQTVISVFSTTSQTANTAAVVALTAAVTANTAAVITNSATNFIPFALGGIVPHAAGGLKVPGHDYSDRTPVLVSSGELILNRAQQGSLANQLASANGIGRLEAVVTGEQLRLVLNNNSRRMGYGEYVTFK